MASTPPGGPDWHDYRNGPNRRDELLSQAENYELRKAIDQLYRPGASVGDGGTAAIIRAEGTHIQKGASEFVHLENILSRQNLSINDRYIAENLYQDLMDALLTKGILP